MARPPITYVFKADSVGLRWFHSVWGAVQWGCDEPQWSHLRPKLSEDSVVCFQSPGFQAFPAYAAEVGRVFHRPDWHVTCRFASIFPALRVMERFVFVSWDVEMGR